MIMMNNKNDSKNINNDNKNNNDDKNGNGNNDNKINDNNNSDYNYDQNHDNILITRIGIMRRRIMSIMTTIVMEKLTITTTKRIV